MSTFTDLEKDAASVDGFVSENGLIPTRRNGPKPSYQYLVDGWNTEIDALTDNFAQESAEAFNKFDLTLDQYKESRGFNTKGTFAAGFTYEKENDVGLDASGNPWILIDTSSLPVTVTAGTTPTNPPYKQVVYGTASQVSTTDGRSVQQRLDDLPSELSVFITSEADRAEVAADAAFVNADVYPDVATGRAAVANGEQFQVVEGDDIVRYRRDSASAQTEMARYPSAHYVSDTISRAINLEYGEILDTAEVVPLWADLSTGNAWVNNGSTGYLIPAIPGETYEITANHIRGAEVIRTVDPVVEGGHAWDSGSGRKVIINARDTSTITILPGEKALWVSGINASLPGNQDTTPVSVKRIGPEYSRQLSILADAVENQGLIDFSEIADNPEIRVGAWVVGTLTEIAGSTHKSFIVPLSAGDKLTFDYEDMEDAILWYWGDSNNRFPIFSGQKDSDEIKSYEYVAKSDMTVRVTSVVEGTVLVNGSESLGMVDAGMFRAYVSERLISSFERSKVTRTFRVNAGDTVIVTKAPAYGAPVMGNNSLRSGFSLKNFSPYSVTPGERFEWVSERDQDINLCGDKDSMFLIRRNTNTNTNTNADDIENVEGTLNLGEPSTVFLTVRNYIVKTEMISEVDHIATSSDLGKTWKYVENTLGNITHAQMFSDGTLMLCTEGAIYWTDDYENLNETLIYDENGQLLDATSNTFYALKSGDRAIYHDGVEMHTWGDYRLDGGVSRIWYTADRGRTVKTAARFNSTPMSGQPRAVRHVHQVSYNKYNGRFYATTGDAGSECMIVVGDYDVASDTWEWNVLASGDDFKWITIFFDEHFAYLVTDITVAEIRDLNGLYRVPVELMHDKTKYEQIWQVPPNELGNVPLARINKDPNGNMILSPDAAGPGRAWVSVGGLDIKMVSISPVRHLMHTTGPNYNGDVFVVASTAADSTSQLWLNRPTYNLTKSLRDIGVPFMKGISMFDGEVTLAD